MGVKALKARERVGGQEREGREVALPVTMGPHDCPLQRVTPGVWGLHVLGPGSGVPGMVLSGQRCVFCLKTLGLFNFQEMHSHLQTRAQVFSGHKGHMCSNTDLLSLLPAGPCPQDTPAVVWRGFSCPDEGGAAGI